MVSVTRPGQRHINIPGIGVTASRRAVGGGNGLLNNLIAYWALDEAAGANNALDKHTNGLTLERSASPGSAAGLVYSGARTFNGTSQSFTRTSQTLLQTGGQDYTFAAWAYFATLPLSAHAFLLSKDDTDTRREVMIVVLTTGYASMTNSGGGYTNATTTDTVTQNAWNFVVGWRDDAAGKFYIQLNGGTIAEGTKASYASTTAQFQLARYGDSTFGLVPRLGPVAMWKSAAGGGGVLTATQRSQLYNAGAGLAYAAFTT